MLDELIVRLRENLHRHTSPSAEFTTHAFSFLLKLKGSIVKPPSSSGYLQGITDWLIHPPDPLLQATNKQSLRVMILGSNLILSQSLFVSVFSFFINNPPPFPFNTTIAISRPFGASVKAHYNLTHEWSAGSLGLRLPIRKSEEAGAGDRSRLESCPIRTLPPRTEYGLFRSSGKISMGMLYEEVIG